MQAGKIKYVKCGSNLNNSTTLEFDNISDF